MRAVSEMASGLVGLSENCGGTLAQEGSTLQQLPGKTSDLGGRG